MYDVITDLLSDGRTSRLYRSLVRDKKIALAAAGFSGFPGMKYAHLFVFYALPTSGHTTQEVADAIHAEIEKLKTTDVSDEELQMIKTREKAGLIAQLGSNEGLANELAEYQTRYGDWRELFKSVDRIDKVSKADIRRIANQIFTENNRSVATLQTAAAQKGGAAIMQKRTLIALFALAWSLPSGFAQGNAQKRPKRPRRQRCVGTDFPLRRCRPSNLWSPRALSSRTAW